MPYFELDFDQYEAESLAHLAEHFDQTGEYLRIQDFYQYAERGQDGVMTTIERFNRLQLVEFVSRSSIRILPQVLSVVSQLRGVTPLEQTPSQTMNINVSGDNSRVNLHSTDNSTNSVAIDYSVFEQIETLIQSEINDQTEQQSLLEASQQLKDAAGTPTFVEKYKGFMSLAANHMSVFAPVFPLLIKML